MKRAGPRPAGDAVVRKTDLLGCRGVIVSDTQVTERPAEGVGESKSPERWVERWTFRACDEFVTVAVTFSANAAGGFDVSAN